MEHTSNNFNEALFNKLFPFYLLIDENCQIVSVGKSFFKITQIKLGVYFYDSFEIKRPFLEIKQFSDLLSLQDQLIFFECKLDNTLLFRGQFEILTETNQLLFVGSPWFYSMDKVSERNLTLSDYAIHDPMMDLLHVLKTAEMASDDLKQLVKTIDKQKKDLKQAAAEINDIALFPKQNPDPLIRINREGDVLLLNPAAEQIDYLIFENKRYKMSEVWKVVVSNLKLEDHRTTIEALHNNKVFSFLIVNLPENGYYNIYGRDITNQKEYESELIKLSLVANKTTNSVIITDANGSIEWVNASFVTSTGYSLEETKGLKPGSFLQGPNTNQETVELIRQNLKKGINFQCEILNYSKTGNQYWVKMNFQPIKDKNGKVIQFFAIQDNITQQKNQQAILARREEKYRSIISNINLGLLEVDLDETIKLVNQSFCDMSGYTSEELIGRKANELFLTNKSSEIIETKRSLRERKVSDAYEIEILDKTKNIKYWRISGAPMFNDKGEQIGSIGIHLDITERKEQEAKLSKLLQTLQSVNQELNDFAYIVSHDLKAPLRSIGSLATWLENDYSDKFDEEGKLSLKLLVQRTQRMHNLIEGVLNYSKVGRTKDQLTWIDTQSLVLKIIDLLSPPDHIQIILKHELPRVYYDEVKLQQVFQNLISNAIKFMDKPQGIIEIDFTSTDGFYEFSVKDNGPGIEKAYFEKVFQIFQTLKSRDEFESTGIGLTIVKKIVESFNGHIKVESEKGISTTFSFSIIKH